MNKKEKIGLGLIVLPPIILVSTVAFYAIFSFVVAQTVDSDNFPVVILRLINVALGFFGLVGVLGIVIGIPAGVILILTGQKTTKDT